MKKSFIIFLSIMCFTLPGMAQQKDDPKCKDHPLFTRMPDSWIHSCDQKEFNVHEFNVGKAKKERVEGKYWKLVYYPQAAVKTRPSELQVLRNFENAIKQVGGTVVWSDKARETLKLTRDGKEVWIEVWAEFTGKYGFFIVERQAMVQDITANATALSDGLKATGHCTVNGILFDTGKSELKPESDQALGEVAKLLKTDAGLNVYVVGHTDNVGSLESNMTLSQDRAAAVVQALITKHGIAASRLKAFGNGPYAPVASNDNDDGKAKNRRVELVKQ